MKRAAERAADLQMALQEAVADKQRREEEFGRERAQLEMEIAQLKMQLNKVRALREVDELAGERVDRRLGRREEVHRDSRSLLGGLRRDCGQVETIIACQRQFISPLNCSTSTFR